jgi:hypothetical protein
MSQVLIHVELTLVTAVPDRKKTVSRAKNTLQGWIAWTTAVAAAVTIPNGVRELRDHARYTRAAVAGTATRGFIFVVGCLKVEAVARCGIASAIGTSERMP